MIDEKLLSILACPACDSRPRVLLKESGLVCTECGRVYPIRDGIPVMLVDEATFPGEEARRADTGDSRA
ncbi:MAG TPA: Trm112 family protein [Armatimonadetes bacterium]|nr:Trm112 family protein [Armatimonadota bacterium]HOM83158.1 Trm112 family protein [Armatimonadota bacterium]HPO74857.1 Trm112 family protein [Armatimonadota bacterium]